MPPAFLSSFGEAQVLGFTLFMIDPGVAKLQFPAFIFYHLIHITTSSPQQLCVCGVFDVTLINRGITKAYVGLLHILLPALNTDDLQLIHIKFF